MKKDEHVTQKYEEANKVSVGYDLFSCYPVQSRMTFPDFPERMTSNAF